MEQELESDKTDCVLSYTVCFLAAGHRFSNRDVGVRRSGFVPLRCVWHFLLPRRLFSYRVQAKEGLVKSRREEKNGTARRPSLPEMIDKKLQS